MIVTCTTPTCENWNTPIAISGDAEAVICGPCGNLIVDLKEHDD